MKLTTHFHLLPRLIMRGATPPVPNTTSWDNFVFTLSVLGETETRVFLLYFRLLEWMVCDLEGAFDPAYHSLPFLMSISLHLQRNSNILNLVPFSFLDGDILI